jgi:hypothetical protein
LHTAIPEIYDAISPFATEPKAIVPLGLFSCEAQIRISKKAMKLSSGFSKNLHLPPLPTVKDAEVDLGEFSETVQLLLNNVFEPKRQLPSVFLIRDEPVADQAHEQTTSILLRWVERALQFLCTGEAIAQGAVPSLYPIRLVRAVAFIAAHRNPADEDVTNTYLVLFTILSSLALHRHVVLFLQPLIHALDKERGPHVPRIAKLISEMVNLNDDWARVFAKAVALHFGVSASLNL